MNIHIFCVGKLKEPFYLQAAAEYAKRLGAFCTLKITELPEQRLPADPSPAQIEAALEREGEALLSRLPPRTGLIALCVEGERYSSPQVAGLLERWERRGEAGLAFAIGGSFGLHQKVKQAAWVRLSMSDMTFPHHLARVMLLEQIYRAFQIRRGSPYHK